MYITIVFCPSCETVFECIRHDNAQPHSQSVAMMAQPIRRAHAIRSPECTKTEVWFEGWRTETRKLETP